MSEGRMCIKVGTIYQSSVDRKKGPLSSRHLLPKGPTSATSVAPSQWGARPKFRHARRETPRSPARQCPNLTPAAKCPSTHHTTVDNTGNLASRNDMVRKGSAPRKPANTKPKQPPKAKAVAPKAAANPGQSPLSPPQPAFQTQLRVLDVFARTFAHELAAPDRDDTLQQIKGDLFNRDFASAFGREGNLAVYAARWSPTRALCYSSIFNGLAEQFCGLLEGSGGRGIGGQRGGEDAERPRLKMVSVGGGAAELAALATFLACDSQITAGDITLIDSGPWASVVDRLHRDLTTPPPLPDSASAAAVASNKSFLSPDTLQTSFHQNDILSLDGDALGGLLGTSPVVVTLLFTLNELYTSGGIGKTTSFLLNLGARLAPGSLLLVVDSPGSYAEAKVGGSSKQYPMRWLLEHALLTTAAGMWERVETCESVWFRLEESLRYPIALENMRYQLHLYRVAGPPKPVEERP